MGHLRRGKRLRLDGTKMAGAVAANHLCGVVQTMKLDVTPSIIVTEKASLFSSALPQ